MSNMVTIETPNSQAVLAGQVQDAAKPATQTAWDPQARGLQVTERAVKRIRAAIAKEGISPEEGGLRLGVLGGGCSGLSYSIKFDTQPRERDRVYEFDGVRVFVDPKSVPLSARHDAGLRRNADAAGIQLHQSEFDAFLWVRFVLFGVGGWRSGSTREISK